MARTRSKSDHDPDDGPEAEQGVFEEATLPFAGLVTRADLDAAGLDPDAESNGPGFPDPTDSRDGELLWNRDAVAHYVNDPAADPK